MRCAAFGRTSPRRPGSTLPTPTTAATSAKPVGTASGSPSGSRSDPASGSPSGSPSKSRSASPSPSTVQVRARDYLGKDVKVVSRQLRALGLEVVVKRVNRPKLPKDRVVGIEPSGQLVQGSTVTLQVSEKRGGG